MMTGEKSAIFPRRRETTNHALDIGTIGQRQLWLRKGLLLLTQRRLDFIFRILGGGTDVVFFLRSQHGQRKCSN